MADEQKTTVIRDFDEIFKYIGNAGVYQIMLYLLLGLPSYFSGYQNIAVTFLAPDQEHWCRIDELQDFPHDQQKCVGIPYDTEENNFHECEYYQLDYDNMTDEEIWNWDCTYSRNGTQPETAECNSWVYDQSEFTRTATTEYDLVCDRTFLVSLASTIYLFGIMVGAPISGYLSDRYGRKMVLLGGCLFELIFALVAAAMPDYISFSCFRFLTSVAVTHAYLTAFVIIMEVIGPKYRTLAGVVYQIWFAIGFMLLPAFSYVVRDFRYLQVVMCVPVIVCVGYIFLVQESPRWLIIQERNDEAGEVIQYIAEVNGTPLTEKLEFVPPEEGEKGEFFDLFRYPVLRREILIIYVGWLTNSLVYYGLSLNTGDLVGSLHLNTFISGFVEIPANIICIFGMAYIGRRNTLAISYLVASLTSFLCIPFLEDESYGDLVTSLTMTGKAAITICFSTIYVYTAELFPTPVRHLAVGSSSMMSRIGALIAPFMGEPLMQYWVPLPSVIFGVAGLLSGMLTFLLPETLNRKMPDTIADAEEIGRLGRKTKPSQIGVEVIVDENRPPSYESIGVTSRDPHVKTSQGNLQPNSEAGAAEKRQEVTAPESDSAFENKAFDADTRL